MTKENESQDAWPAKLCLRVMAEGVPDQVRPWAGERLSIGRRPHNDVVIDHLAVSGEHALLLRRPEGAVSIEDLGSTNGTYVNGQRVHQCALQPGDQVTVGRHQLRLVSREECAAPVAMDGPTPLPAARLRVLSGAAAGREVALSKPVTTMGRPGVAVASIHRQAEGFLLTCIAGSAGLLLNDQPVGAEPAPLRHGDRITLAGVEMLFLQDDAP
ncbi:FHA domain-containing protein [Melaminivora sp.]|uniref:FHA domain-containing protein n=1 Tax=Melaminivora sp. TaxID=1933032 RepID=UPI0028AF7798|nr:FHA domain-containing protein [Melaminivora sp.]